MTQSTPIVERHNGVSFLEAHVLERDLSSDLVLLWSTAVGPYELIKKCDWATHAPKHAQAIEVIADTEVLEVDTVELLEANLKDRNIVRFNVNDWSVTWLAGLGGEPAEVQVALGKLPTIMNKMVRESVSGIPVEEVDTFFAELTARAL